MKTRLAARMAGIIPQSPHREELASPLALRTVLQALAMRLYLSRGIVGGSAMRKLAPLLLLLGSAWPAMAEKIVSIEQFEQMLDSLHGKSDAKVAHELSDVDLKERVSPVRLAHWETEFPGDRTREQLIKMADRAAFLNPLATEVLRDPPPDMDTQEKMLALVTDYVQSATTRLPNFYAKRETTHFEDEPSQLALLQPGQSASSMAGVQSRIGGINMGGPGSGVTNYVPLRATGTYSAIVTYRDGHEVRDTDLEKDAKAQPAPGGLTTGGEFGPILIVVAGDAFRSQVSWLRWEQGVSDPVAVFQYVVPLVHSNFTVMIALGGKIVQLHPGYHGEIAIDPATGAVLRMSIVADLEPPYQEMQTATMVEFAPVMIGDRSFISPVHAVAFSKFPVPGAAQDTQSSTVTVQTQLNDVSFTKYHLFGSEAHILTGNVKMDAAPPDASAAPTVVAPDSAPASGPASSPAAPSAPNADSSPAPSDNGK